MKTECPMLESRRRRFEKMVFAAACERRFGGPTNEGLLLTIRIT